MPVRKSRRALALTAAAACLAAATLYSPPAGGSTPKPRAGERAVVGHVLPKTRASAALEYWTPARMKAARPYPAPARAGAPDAVAPASQPSGSPRSIAGSAPSGETVDAAASQSPAGPSPMGYSYPFPFTRTNVLTNYKVYPWKAVGKLFFVQNGGSFVCSGSAVQNAPGTKVVVWTAGHCVSDGAGHFDSQAVFVPAYKNGSAPFGQFPATGLFTTSAWHTSADLRYDLGSIRVGKNANGQTLYSKTGKLGFAYNQSRVQHWNSFGYPAASPFNGQLMVNCQGSHAVDDGSFGAPATIGIGCDMTGGSSGGPWILKFGTQNLVNGLNSYGYNTQPLAMYSPYFDSTANAVRCLAADCP